MERWRPGRPTSSTWTCSHVAGVGDTVRPHGEQDAPQRQAARGGRAEGSVALSCGDTRNRQASTPGPDSFTQRRTSTGRGRRRALKNAARKRKKSTGKVEVGGRRDLGRRWGEAEASPGLGQGPEDPDENTFLCNGSRSLNKKPQDDSRGQAGGRGRTWARDRDRDRERLWKPGR